jgi:hypothetical protein
VIILKISEKLNLNKTQFELDFIDIDVDEDIPLFIDPNNIIKSNTPLIQKMSTKLESFFDRMVSFVKINKIQEAWDMFINLGEVNDIYLGLSKAKVRGNGIGNIYRKKLFDEIVSKIKKFPDIKFELQDIRVFVIGVDRDRISDMIANIIRDNLIEYTVQQCELNNIKLTKDVPSGIYWDNTKNKWIQEYKEMLIIDNKKVILVPKRIVTYTSWYTPQKYKQHFVLSYLQEENILNNTKLVNTKETKKGKIRVWVNKKDILKDFKDKEIELNKEWLLDFTNNHYEIFQKFKEQIKLKKNSIGINENELSIKIVSDYLIKKLNSIKVGRDQSSEYHNAIIGILELLFYPNLSNPKKETPINEGRKRIDITFENSAEEGFFFRLPSVHGIPSSYIMIECKNYTEDVKNPEVDQLSGRFSVNRGKFGVLAIRNLDNNILLLKRCKDIWKDKQEIIIPLSDEDIIKALNSLDKNRNIIEEIISEKFFEIIK